MSKSLRLSEKWFRFGLWLIAIVFATFLTGLGNLVVSNLPLVEPTYTTDDFVDKAAADPLEQKAVMIMAELKNLSDQEQSALSRYEVATAATKAARETFDNWLATRGVTQRSDQDAEVIRRTKELDNLKEAERQPQKELQDIRQRRRTFEQTHQQTQNQLQDLRNEAQQRLEVVWQEQELRVFLYRLVLTIPLLGLAGWLFMKKRKSQYWPFVWGFIYFALFVFFIELVPYLPSYGGFVRYIVGIIVTVVIGRQVILGLTRYLEKQKQVEALPDVERRKELDYDLVLTRLGRKVCPGCERPVNLEDPAIDYCANCGICLHNRCEGCGARKSAFSRFCFSCGKSAKEQG
ncbi:serine endopeptidase [Laribacter hongkongensis]|uniref:zinc ribbon domain-containing protein n=1 Tax=Laribacter hongkongensis TaxID=168471 RepID=UPI001EFCC4D9|nr:zinc ribbon domain-containing protein [Laribacter hongkongensis]MCG9075318.1 serine endopeptidase [Laribacter hongkongensis]